MGFLKNFFGSSKEDEQKKKQEECRTRGNTLLSGLNAAMARAVAAEEDESTAIRDNKLFIYQNNVSSLHNYLNSLPVMYLDTTEIDRELGRIVEKMEEAVSSDLPRTLDQGMTALTRGILVARADIAESEQAAMRNIIDERLDLLNALLTAVSSAINIDNAERKLAQARQLVEENQAIISAQNAELEAHPERYELIAQGNIRQPENQEEKDFVSRYNARADIMNIINAQERNVGNFLDTISTSEIAIQQSEVAYLTISSKMKVDTTKLMKKMFDDTSKAISENQNRLRELNDITGQISSLYAGWEEPDFIRLKRVRATLQLEKERAEKQKQERAKAAAEAERLRLQQQEEMEKRIKEKQKTAAQTQAARQTIAN